MAVSISAKTLAEIDPKRTSAAVFEPNQFF